METHGNTLLELKTIIIQSFRDQQQRTCQEFKTLCSLINQIQNTTKTIVIENQQTKHKLLVIY